MARAALAMNNSRLSAFDHVVNIPLRLNLPGLSGPVPDDEALPRVDRILP